jgi:DNA-binding PucR family transcriptional regulator
MKTTDEYGQKLVELIERSAHIDALVMKSRQAAAEVKQELEALREKQRETTNLLHTLEVYGNNTWENIGSGG